MPPGSNSTKKSNDLFTELLERSGTGGRVRPSLAKGVGTAWTLGNACHRFPTDARRLGPQRSENNLRKVSQDQCCLGPIAIDSGR